MQGRVPIHYFTSGYHIHHLQAGLHARPDAMTELGHKKVPDGCTRV